MEFKEPTPYPFSDEENAKSYDTNTFIERGVEVTFLKLSNQHKPKSGNRYRIGFVDVNYKFYWFYYNQYFEGRTLAIKAYEKLKAYCEEKGLGIAFLYKL